MKNTLLLTVALLPLTFAHTANKRKASKPSPSNNMSIEAACALSSQLDNIQEEKILLFHLADKKFSVKEDKEYIWTIDGCSFHVKIDDDGKLNRRGTVCFNASLPKSIPDTYNQAKTLKDLKKLGEPKIDVKGKIYSISFLKGTLKKTLRIDKDGRIRGRQTIDNLGCAPMESSSQ